MTNVYSIENRGVRSKVMAHPLKAPPNAFKSVIITLSPHANVLFLSDPNERISFSAFFHFSSFESNVFLVRLRCANDPRHQLRPVIQVIETIHDEFKTQRKTRGRVLREELGFNSPLANEWNRVEFDRFVRRLERKRKRNISTKLVKKGVENEKTPRIIF